MPNGAPSPDLFNITDKCLKFSVSAQKALQEEGIDLPVGKKPYFASHMQPETILEESEMDEKEGGIAYIVVNYRHIVDYDLSS